ncbi:hypothetical protein HZQ67_04090 [Elizabethkingia anophelis]|uniref:hypothetical protein n=1 Tax=Elizabethkingia anophelis TaxID=1117645 RepID=UPI0004E2AD6C|nr:hypothetical protein [Elizabethkingia anophelis]KFC35507.1 hypothetical protein FF18_03785 [Elizabethkingia anophelis]MCT3786546.1 hypothetical protein [Elizabethkingia anophelis]MDV3499503.1 hypothetical protein [Elizabethkingia anophelis]
MECWEIREFKNDLDILISLVEKYKIPCEVTKVHDLLGKFYEINNFEYSLRNITFKINKKIAGSQPDMEEYYIFFNNDISTIVEKQIDKDCISSFLFEINIEGHISTRMDTLKSCWHLDKHIESEDGNDGIPKFTHPSYHFQFGGEFIEKCDKGELGILANPRIPHPPMDIFLGFNFIINNFYNRRDYSFVEAILNNYDYQQIIKRAQDRLWHPYFKAYDSINNHNDFTINRVFPLYIN